MTTIREDLKYTESHEWVKVSGNTCTIGITDYAQHALGDIVFVELPEAGKKLTKGNAFGVIESIKSVSDIYSPISGKIVDANKELSDAPETVNASPYDSWIIKVEIDNLKELDSLMDANEYKKLCNEH